MLYLLPELSLWEIAHYWHDVSPNSTRYKRLPVEVEKTLRCLAFITIDGLYFRCLPKSVYHHAFEDSQWALSTVARIFKRRLWRVVKGINFNKGLLNSISLTRVALAKWCKENDEDLPAFWFPLGDPLIDADITSLDEKAALSYNGKYIIFPLFSSSKDSGSPGTTQFPENKKNPIAEEISRIGKENAKKKYQGLDEIKRRFITYFYADQFKSQSLAARQFFSTLSNEEKKIVVPSLKSSKESNTDEESKAIRTLTDALRQHKKNKSAFTSEGLAL